MSSVNVVETVRVETVEHIEKKIVFELTVDQAVKLAEIVSSVNDDDFMSYDEWEHLGRELDNIASETGTPLRTFLLIDSRTDEPVSGMHFRESHYEV